MYTPMNNLELLLRALQEKYTTDNTIPGVHLAWIGDKFYGCIKRFRAKYGQQPYVVMKEYGDTAGEVIDKLWMLWIRAMKNNVDNQEQK